MRGWPPGARGTAWLVLAALLCACTPAPMQVRQADQALLAAQLERETLLATRPDWRLVGRIAVSADGDGGSGRIEWLQRGERFDIRLSAPVTRQSWRLRGVPGAAMLEGLDGGPLQGDNAEALLYEATGWLIPLQAMAHWARGARADGQAALSFDEHGRPALLEQGGWLIEYREWSPAASPQLPRRVFAERDGGRVRLTVERWETPEAEAAGGSG